MDQKAPSVPPGFFAGNIKNPSAISDPASITIYVRLADVAVVIPRRFGCTVVLKSDKAIDFEGQSVDEILWAIECADREAIELPARAQVDVIRRVLQTQTEAAKVKRPAPNAGKGFHSTTATLATPAKDKSKGGK